MLNFTGNTRRPRQVNLSGRSRSTTSHAASKGSTPGASLTAVATARELRAQRESERQRSAAALRIQSAFRGYKSRKVVRQDTRTAWDNIVGFSETVPTTSIGGDNVLQADSIALLLQFWDPKDDNDLERLYLTVSAFHPQDDNFHILDRFLRMQGRSCSQILRLSRKVLLCLTTVASKIEDIKFQAHVLSYLAFLSRVTPYLPGLADGSYFEAVTEIVERDFLRLSTSPGGLSNSDRGLTASITLLRAIVLPLESQPADALHAPSRYPQFLQTLLTAPNLDIKLFAYIPIDAFQRLLNLESLFDAASSIEFLQSQPTKALWLLSYIILLGNTLYSKRSSGITNLEDSIFLHPLYNQANRDVIQEPASLFASCAAAINQILEIYGADIAQNWAAYLNSSFRPPQNQQESQGDAFAALGRRLGHSHHDQLPAFVTNQLEALLGNNFVQGLVDLIRVDNVGRNDNPALLSHRNIAQSLLLHCLIYFRHLRQRLHNKLFLARSADGTSLLFALFSLVKQSRTFKSGRSGIRDILMGLKNIKITKTNSAIHTSSEWISIFLFFDMYSFASIVTDDEEFFDFRDKSLTPEDLQYLIKFLKNVAFVSFFYVNEIEKDTNLEALSPSDKMNTSYVPNRTNLAGVTGVTLPWIRSLTVRILRSLHRRDSRQRFLPENFWLMSEVEMEGSTLLVAEEEARQQQSSELDVTDDTDSEDDDDHQATPLIHNTPSQRQHEKAARRNYLAAVTPRLEIIQNLPFLIPFKTRVKIFRDFIHLDETRRGTGDAELWRLNQAAHFLDHNGRKPKHHGTIRRESVFEDAYASFYNLGEGFKEPIQITFVDSFGAEEAGIDGGGILKEFLSSVVQEAFREAPIRGVPFFTETDDHLLYPNPTIFDQISEDLMIQVPKEFRDFRSFAAQEIGDLLKRYEFLGRIIGKCMYEGILVDVVFSDFFLLKWSKVGLGNDDVGLGVDDLKSLDRSLWKGLQSLKHYDESTIEDLSLTFSTENFYEIEDPMTPGRYLRKSVPVDLKPDGSEIPVTASNRLEYIHLLSRYKLVTQGRPQTNAFLKGLSSIIAPRWLSMFNQSELQTLVGGNDSPLDVEDLRRNTVYGGIYTIGDDNEEHPTIVMFWKVMTRLKESDRRAVLKFVTSVSRAPLLGFSALNPKFSIRDAGGDSNRLPSTSTCVNLLKLPRYSSDRMMEEKLLYAANAGAGFDLS